METIYRNRNTLKMSERIKQILYDLVAYSFILLFIYTASDKIWNFHTFHRVMSLMPGIEFIGAKIAYFIPTSEIVISLLLFFPLSRRFGLLAAFILMIIFTIYLVFMTIYASDLPCNCGGVLTKLTWNQHIFFNLFFICIAFFALKVKRSNLLTGPII